MAQTLLLGLGGTGSRVVNNVVKELHLNKKEINNGEICCAVLDTNVNDNDAIVGTGTGVPVIPTSKAQKIRGYFEDYNYLHMDTWCPQSPSFMEQSMIDGASELRVKSRIAFMDCLESGVVNQLELMINDVLKNNSGSKIRVMIVSSLSGGTGSGMFIQVALWLRKFLSESQITIRGIFMLPDVFVTTVKDIRDNKKTKVRHYCNAYAAIRELNAITKIMKDNSIDLPEKITIGDLFDSIRDKDSGKPVYDFAFFVDDKDENGVRLDSIRDYEQMVAQLVYMQLYAPMKDDMYSEEDNAFLSFLENDEPLYGSCGTAKAVYPAESVKTYCAIRAAQDSLTSGWKKIDDEINSLIEEKKQNEKDGIFTGEAIDVREQYIRLFDDKTSVKAEEVGKDRFFFSIAKDIKNETKKKGENGKTIIHYSDKVEDFVKLLKSKKIETLVTQNSGVDDFALNAEQFVDEEHTKDQLLEQVKSDREGMEEAIDTFDAKVEEYADRIVNSVFPYSVGEIQSSNACSIYGLLTKQNDMGEWDFIHPVAARYVLYKLVENMEHTLKGIILASSREEAISGGEIETLFDNPATAETEKTPEEFLENRKWYQNEEKYLDLFEDRYAQFITKKIELCEKYEKECLQVSVYRKLIKRLNDLIKQMELFFKELDDAQKKLKDELEKNIAATNSIVGKTMFILGDPEDKEAIYQTLEFELDRSNVKINKSVIDAIYGRLCAEKRPSNTENEKYLGIGVIAAFVYETVKSYREKVDNDPANSENVNLDIYTALCRESDAAAAKDDKPEKKSSISDFDIMTGEVKADNTTAQRHASAFNACKDKLLRMAAPFLIHEKEISDNELGTVTTRPKTFWGFNPEVSIACPQLSTVLGINADLQQDDAYPKNELYCYRAVYGMEARYVPKFNELRNGEYFKCYSAVVDEMVSDAEGKQGDRAYVRTPHLDKSWHKILPFITGDKQKADELKFFHGLWLAIAYGVLRTDKDGNICVRRSVDGGFGNYMDVDVLVKYKGKNLTKTDVAKLIEALKTDMVFVGSDIPAVEAKFQEELEEMVTYVGTDVLKGLTVKKDDLNPINVITRYSEGLRSDKNITAALIGALEKIASELAEQYNATRSAEQLDEAKFGICRRIYDSSKRTKGKAEIFGRWEQAFEAYKIKEFESSDDSSK